MDPSIAELAERLAGSYGSVVGDVHATPDSRWALVRAHSQPDPVKVSVDVLGLERYLTTAVGNGGVSGVWPDVDDRTAAWRLASVHLWEEIDSANAVVHEVGLDRQGRIWRRTGEPLDPDTSLPPAGYRRPAEY
ncbi:MAG TPA: hypothetical protein VNR17_13285 [Luteimicrobium sp.]|nr:hypothetical protein [Luteimicrobium sp.]